MNAKLLLLVSLVGLVLAQSNSCPAALQPSCVSTVGGTCAAQTTTAGATVCDATNNLYCSAGACASTVAADSVCSLTAGANQCGYSTTTCMFNTNYTDYACLNRYLNPGQTCTSDAQCYYGGNAGGATNSTCVSGKCFGSIGSNCTASSKQCPAGSYCMGAPSGVCTATAADASCLIAGFSDDTCPSGYCTTAGKCGSRFQGTAGSTCGNDDECGDGLFCATADKVCRAVFTSSGTACDTLGSNTGCATYEYCSCNSARNLVCQAPRGHPTGFVAAANAYYSCRASNPNCVLDPWCSQCQSQTCAFFKVRDGSNAAYNPSFQCGLSASQRTQAALCKADSATSASSTVAASVLIASAAAFVVLA